MRDIAVPDKRITEVRDSAGPGEVRKDSLDPDIINAIAAAGDAINSAGDVAESLIKIGVAAKGGADIAKKGLEKIKGDKDNNAGSGDASDKE